MQEHISTPFLRPEVGLQTMMFNNLLTPKLFVGYGINMSRSDGADESAVLRLGSSFTMLAGVSLNLGTLARRRQMKKEARPME